jgi:hypothetical protein
MRIDGAPLNQTSLGLNPGNVNRAGTPDGAAVDPTATAERFQPTAALLSLIDALGRIPAVRQNVVSDVAGRLKGGDLGTPQARQQTVESILGAGPGRD